MLGKHGQRAGPRPARACAGGSWPGSGQRQPGHVASRAAPRADRRDGLDRAIEGLAAAQAAGLRPGKLNAALQRGVNDDEALDLLAFAQEHGYELRFIESMPLDGDRRWRREDIVDQAEILRGLEQQHVLEPMGVRGSAPAARWQSTAGRRPSASSPPSRSRPAARATGCGSPPCLFARTETYLRAALRGGASDAELGRLLAGAVAGKAAGHGDRGAVLLRAGPSDVGHGG